MLGLVFALILHVASGESINAALDSARAVYKVRSARSVMNTNRRTRLPADPNGSPFCGNQFYQTDKD